MAPRGSKLLELVVIACSLVCLIPAVAEARRNSRWSNWKKPAAFPPTVFGSVFCDSCLEKTFTFNTVPIPNVTVSVDCGSDFQGSNSTSAFGIFLIEIPAAVASSSAKLAACAVKVAADFSAVEGDLATCTTPIVFASSPPLSPSAIAPTQSGWPFYSAGPFFFQPPKPLAACSKAPDFGFPAVDDHKTLAAPAPLSSNHPGFGFPPLDQAGAFPPHPNFGSFLPPPLPTYFAHPPPLVESPPPPPPPVESPPPPPPVESPPPPYHHLAPPPFPHAGFTFPPFPWRHAYPPYP